MSDQFTKKLSTDLSELILSHLPIPSLLRASRACKLFHSLISSPTFPRSNHALPWFFLHGIHNTSAKNNQSFAYDPSSDSWFLLPSASDGGSLAASSNGFLFSTAPSFLFSPRVLNPRWISTSPLRFSRINPLLGVFYDDRNVNPKISSGGGGRNFERSNSTLIKFIVVGGVRFIGGLVDIEDRLAVEVYDPCRDCWDLCPPLPADFGSHNSSQTLSSALFNRKFFVFGIYTCFITWFDLDNYVWSQVFVLKPQGLAFGFLIACDELLVLAGMCTTNSGCGPLFRIWRVDDVTMAYTEIAVMPSDLLFGLVDSDEEDKFASLKCVGMGRLLYVFNEEYHKKYPACVCEITSGGKVCNWRKVPQLPSPVNKFHKVISFCSAVAPQDLFPDRE